MLRRLSGRSLADAFDPKSNSLNLLRLVFAYMVLVGHAQHIGFNQVQLHVGSLYIHEVAVDGFFVISGFLISGSFLASSSSRDYLRRRFARIFPGFWACLAVTAFLIAPVLWWHDHGGLSGFAFFSGSESAVGYVLKDSALYLGQQHVSSVLPDANVAFQLNGSLWTLFYEFGAYVGIMVLGVLGVLKARSFVPFLVLAGLWLGLVWFVHDPDGFRTTLHSPLLAQNSVRLGLMFATGMILRLWQDRVPISDGLAVVAAAVFAASVPMTNWRIVGFLAFAYLVLYAGVRLPFPQVGKEHDISYGVYLYAWPLSQLFWAAGVPDLGIVPYIIAVAIATSGIAWLSFLLVERPSIRWAHARSPKRRQPRPGVLAEPAASDRAG